MAKFSVCRIYKVTLWLNFSYNYSVNLLQILHLYIHPQASDFIIPWCLTHRITGAPPSVSVALKIALKSLDHHGITITLAYSS